MNDKEKRQVDRWIGAFEAMTRPVQREALDRLQAAERSRSAVQEGITSMLNSMHRNQLQEAILIMGMKAAIGTKKPKRRHNKSVGPNGGKPATVHRLHPEGDDDIKPN
jgi:hypothetical protein